MPGVTPIRVRYKDTDTMSVVYYGNSLRAIMPDEDLDGASSRPSRRR